MPQHGPERYARYLERESVFKKFGYDIERERGLIIEYAQPLAGTILEVGTGKGYLTAVLAKKGYRCTTVDISEEEQAHARAIIERLGLQDHVDFVIDDAEHLSFTDGSFDAIFVVNVIHHLRDPVRLVDELFRVASKTGKIILSDFNAAGLEAVRTIHADEGRTHSVSALSLNDIEKYIVSKNCTIEKRSSTFQDTLIVYKRTATP